MASYHLSPRPHDPSDGSSSVFLPTVSLYDWWLIRPENESDGRRVGVAGFTSRKGGLVRRPVRVFKSAPITKVYSIFTVETADNVTVVLNGFNNVSRTAESGFSSEVCKQFVMGFPAHWEKLVAEEATIKTPADIDSHVPDQVGPSKKDQKSPRRQKSEKESQPEIESPVPNPVSRSKKDQTSPGKENQPSTRTKCTLFTENVAGDLSSDPPEDAMEEVRVDPLASALVKFASSSHHHIDQITPGKKDQASPGKHKSVETPSQTAVEPSSAPPLVKPRRSSRRQTATLGKGDVRRQTTTPVDIPQKKGMVSPSKNDQKSSSRQKSKKDQNSPRGEKSKKENQPSTRTTGDCFTENVAGDLGSDLLGDAMDEVGEDPSSASPLVKSEGSSYHLMDQSSPGVKDQTSAGEEDQISARTRSHYDTECTRNHLSPDQPRDDIEVSREEPSSAPQPLKSKISSLHHIDQTTPGKHMGVTKASQTVEEPSSAPPLVKPRRPHRRQIGKGDVRRQTTTPIVTPQTKGMVSPDSFKRSRSGRILLPPLAFWRNELLVYDVNGNVAGVQGLDMAADSKSKGTGNKSRRK